MKANMHVYRILGLFLYVFLLNGMGCSDGLWSPPEEASSPSDHGWVMDRAEEDFEGGTRWTDTALGPDPWAVVVKPDRPRGDALVLTNTDAGEEAHVALWQDAELIDNDGAAFQVLAKAEMENWMGVVINYQPDGSFYLFRVQPTTCLWELQKVGPSGAEILAGGFADEEEKLILPNEYIRLSLSWSKFHANRLQAFLVSPSTGFHPIASVSIPSPLVGGKAGVYSLGGGAFFDDARLRGTVRLNMRPTITVHANRPMREIRKGTFGVNFVWKGSFNGLAPTVYDPLVHQSEITRWFQLLNRVYPVGISSTRYPGGLESFWYFWKHGIGPVSSRGNVLDALTINLGTDEFLQFTEELGAEAVVTLTPVFSNLPAGDPAVAQYAADWVEYCNAPNDGSNPGGGIDYAALRAANGHSAPYGVKYWEIGTEIGSSTTPQLAEIINSISDATRAIDPSIELGFQDHVFSEPYSLDPFGPGAKDYYTNAQGNGILDLAGDAFDFWEPHPYGPALTEIGPVLFMNGATITVSHQFSEAGKYLFTLRGQGLNPTEDPVRSYRFGTLQVMMNGSTVWDFEVASQGVRDWTQEVTVPEPGTYEIRIMGDNLIQSRLIYLTHELTVTHLDTDKKTSIDLTNSEEIYGIMQATAPHVDFVYFGLFHDYYGGKPIYATEWNTTMGFFDAPNDLKWALSNADYLNVFLKNGASVTNFWDLTSDTLLVGLFEGVLDGYPDPRLRPTAYVFQLYRDLLQGDVLDITTDSPYYLRGIDGLSLGAVGSLVNLRIPYLSAIASLSPSQEMLSLIVINKHGSLPIQSDINLEGFQGSGDGFVSVIDADTIYTNNERDTCPDPGECVKITTTPWHGTASDFTYWFPPHSITAFTFYAAGADPEPPASPTNLSAEVLDRSVRVQWSPSPSADVVGYNLYRSRWPDGPYGNRINKDLIVSTEYLDEDLDPSITFYYAVASVDRNQDEGPRSNKAAVLIPGNPPAVYYPMEATTLLGTPDGNLEALRLSDSSIATPLEGNAFFRIRSASGSTDWVLTFQTSENPDSLSNLSFYFQARYAYSGWQAFYLWNATEEKWDPLRITPLQANQMERYMETFSDSGFVRDHISESGEVRLRIQAQLADPFTCYADYCAMKVR